MVTVTVQESTELTMPMTPLATLPKPLTTTSMTCWTSWGQLMWARDSTTVPSSHSIPASHWDISISACGTWATSMVTQVTSSGAT